MTSEINTVDLTDEHDAPKLLRELGHTICCPTCHGNKIVVMECIQGPMQGQRMVVSCPQCEGRGSLLFVFPN